MVEEHDIQQRLAAFIERETEYWDFWGTIRIVKGGNILWEIQLNPYIDCDWLKAKYE